MPKSFLSMAYGLRVQSPFELPELPATTLAGADAGPDVRIRRSRVIPVGAPILEEKGCSFWTDAKKTTLFYKGVGYFQVVEGRRILIDAVDGADQRDIRFFLLGPALAMLLHQRELLVIHGNCVQVGQTGVLFTGHSGRGKSTMAAALCERGHCLVGDDVTPVDLGGAAPKARCGFPHIRLLPESFKALGRAIDEPRLHTRADKYAFRVDGAFARSAVQLSHIYLLTDSDKLAIEPLGPGEAFGQIVASTYPVIAHLMEANGTASRHFAQCVKLAGQVKVARLLRPRALELLPKIAELIEAEAGKCGRAA